MLFAFTALPLVELRQRDKSKIESITTYGDKIFVGLNTGSLRIYRVNEASHPRSENGDAHPDHGKSPASQPTPTVLARPVDLLREIETFSNRPIEQLAIIREANILISLSNYQISMHDTASYELVAQLSKTKNATTFAVTSNIVKDQATGIPELVSQLAVAVKRKLLLWTWHESELSSNVVEVVLSGSIRTLTWASATKIVCGMNSGYVMLDVTTSQVEDILAPGAVGSAGEATRFGSSSAGMGYIGLGGYVPKPLATRLAEDEMLLAKDINSLFINSDGTALEKRQVPWQQAPESIGYSYPYMLSLQAPAKGALEVRNPETLTVVQSISLPNASQMHFPPPNVSLAHNGFHVVSDRCVWRMQATDYDSQVEELVDTEAYDEAISLLGMLEDALLKNKDEKLREVQMLKAQSLFDQRKYAEALEIFGSVSAPPERVIMLYPPNVTGASLEEPSYEKTEPDHDNGTNGETTQESISDNDRDMSTPKPAGIAKFFMSQSTESDAGSVRSAKRETSDTSLDKKPEEAALTGKDLESALLELNAFLVGTRNRIKRWLDPETGHLRPEIMTGENGSSLHSAQMLLHKPLSAADIEREKQLLDTAMLVDTTLFRSYMLIRPSLAGSLFRIPNFCDPVVVNEKLLESRRYNDLVDFFHGKKLHRPALELLQKFGEADRPDEEAPALHGPERTVTYLQNLEPDMADLILEFAAWPLKKDPELGLEIFTADTDRAKKLPRDRVEELLERIDKQLAVRYLEYIIGQLNDLTPDFHNHLVNAYLQELTLRPARESASWSELMERLLTFLRSSSQYSLSRAFGLIPRNDPSFYEAQAVVLSNMGQHKQALEIYVFKIKDFDKAEEYCNQIHVSETSPASSPTQSRRGSTSEQDEPPPSIYHTLLSLYLAPPPPYQPNWQPALSLLSKHGSRLPAASTLDLIPAKLPVAELESYFRGHIRATSSVVNEAKIVAGLRNSEVVAAQAALLLGDSRSREPGGRNRRVVVTDDRVCGVCHKRLGGSVVAALPDNTVVHYGCLGRTTGKHSTTRPPSRANGTDGRKGVGWNISS